MATNKQARLSRLVRVVQILYRREAAELARRQLEVREAGEVAAAAEGRLDAPLASGDFISQLSLVRAARARQHLADADARVLAQLNNTMDAMSKKRGAESEHDVHALEVQKRLVVRDTDELLERIARPQKASLG